MALLAPTLTFPLSDDLSTFIAGAKTIISGGKLYVDFIDIKSPMVFYIFSLIIKIFGYSEFGPRLFDFLYQLLTALFIYKITIKYTESENISFFSAVFYSLTYTVFDLFNTLQIETLIALPLILSIDFHLRKDKKLSSAIFLGICLGFIVSLKISLVFFAIGFIFDDIISKRLTFLSLLKKYLITFSILTVIFIISLFPLIDFQIYLGYKNVLTYLTYYTNLNINAINNFYYWFLLIGSHFNRMYSKAFILITLISLYGIYKQKNNPLRSFYLTVCYLTIFGFLSIVLEHKFFDYHFARIYIPLMIICSSGFEIIRLKLFSMFINKSQLYKSIVILSCFILLAISPFPKFLNSCSRTWDYFTNTYKYDSNFGNLKTGESIRVQQKIVSDFLKNNIKNSDKIEIIKNGPNLIRFFVNKGNFNKFAHSAFYLCNFKIPNWQTVFLEEYKSANWVVIQNNDPNSFIFQYESSYKLISSNKVYKNILDSNFKQVMNTDNYFVFKSNKNN